MHIANLQAARRSRGIAAFQWVRAVFVLALVGAGAFAVSLTVEGPSASSEVAETQVATQTMQASDQPTQATPAQIASADPDVADLTIDHAMDTGSSAAPAPEGAALITSEGGRGAATMPATRSTDAPLHETKQASANEPPPPTAPEMTGAVNVSSVTTNSSPASDLIDLNTASFEKLNALKGAGPLGRAIIKGRPYASVEDLVTRKVMRRSVYEKIKDQVTVR